MERGECMVKKQRLKSFSPEAVLKAFTVECLREDACCDYILKTLHPDGAHCPACGMRLEDETTVKNFWELKRCECKVCNRWFSATIGTILHNSQLDMRQFFVLATFLPLGMPVEEVARIVGISPGTVRLWKIKLSQTEKWRLF